MAIVLSDVTNVLQKVIMPFVRDNFPTATILLDQVKRNAGVTFMNNKFYASIRSKRHGGVTNLGSDSAQLVSDKASHAQLNVGVKILTGTFDISKLTIDATKTAKGAVENQLTGQAKSLASDFARHANRQYFGDGSGAIAQVAATTSTSKSEFESIDADGRVLDTRVSPDHYGTVNDDIKDNKYMTQGMAITCGSGSGSVGTIGTVTYSSSGGTISYNADVSATVSQLIYKSDADGISAGTAEINGLADALKSDSAGTSTYAGTTHATFSMASAFGSTSEALSLSRMEDKYLEAKEYAMTGDRYAIFVNKTLFKKYGDILTAMRRAVNQTELIGGWTGLEFAAGAGKVGVFLDYDVPDGECLIINLDTLTITQVSDLDWMENPNGGGLVRKVGYITFQATMVWFTNLLCLAPAANAKLTQKTD